jgi:hypothetical protein
MRSRTVFGLSAVFVLLFTFLQWFWPNVVIFYLLWPGNVIGLMITGIHGGTLAQEQTASILGFLVNAIVYLFVGLCVHKIYLRFFVSQKTDIT